MAKNREDRNCKCCNVAYKYCPHCSSYDRYPTWMLMFHDENCMNIFNVICDYNTDAKTKEEAKAVLMNCDLTNKDSFVEPIKNKINEIFDIENNVESLKEEPQKVVEPQSETKAEEAEVEEAETVKETKASTRRPYKSKN